MPGATADEAGTRPAVRVRAVRALQAGRQPDRRAAASWARGTRLLAADLRHRRSRTRRLRGGVDRRRVLALAASRRRDRGDLAPSERRTSCGFRGRAVNHRAGGLRRETCSVAPPHGRTSESSPPSQRISEPHSASIARDCSVTLAMLPIEASASPRKPIVPIRNRSSASVSLLVA